jgi:hypothetical protein
VKPASAEEMRKMLVRYYPLMTWLESQCGYGTYILKVHGKRPVKIWEVLAEENLEPDDERAVQFLRLSSDL